MNTITERVTLVEYYPTGRKSGAKIYHSGIEGLEQAMKMAGGISLSNATVDTHPSMFEVFNECDKKIVLSDAGRKGQEFTEAVTYDDCIRFKNGETLAVKIN